MKKFLILATIAATMGFADDLEEAAKIGTNWGVQTQEFGTSNFDNMSKSLSGTGTISTVDGSSSSSSSIVCGTSGDFMQISVSESGNLSVSVKIDDDLDGNFDESFKFSDISGICTNGVRKKSSTRPTCTVKCSQNYVYFGTLGDGRVSGNCRGTTDKAYSACLNNGYAYSHYDGNTAYYYKPSIDTISYLAWQYNGTTLSLVESDSNSVGSCYCVGSECSGASIDKRKALEDMGGVISNLVGNKGLFVITDTSYVNDTTLKYTGQDMSQCTNATAQGSTYQSVDKDGDLEEQGKQQITQQKSDNLSAWSIFVAGSENKDKTATSDWQLEFENNLEKQAASARSSATFDSTNQQIVYKDANGTTIRTDIYLPDVDVDISYCEVNVLETDTTIYSDGTNKASTKSEGGKKGSSKNTQTYATEIRQCKDGVCTVNKSAGETLKYDCGKIDDMAEAVSMLSIAEEVQKDSVCR